MSPLTEPLDLDLQPVGPTGSVGAGLYASSVDAARVARIRIATAVLLRNGLVLLAHRHPLRQAYPDRWGFVGGHVEPGELPHQAVRRECHEEIGVHIHDPVPFPMTVSNPTLDMHGFVVTRWTGEPVNAAPEEHDDLRWFRPSDLAKLKMAHPESLSSILSAVQLASGPGLAED